jgi:hypothetical protein
MTRLDRQRVRVLMLPSRCDNSSIHAAAAHTLTHCTFVLHGAVCRGCFHCY